MKKIYILVILLFSSLSFGLTFEDGKQVDDSQSNDTSQKATNMQTSKNEGEVKSFKPFDCSKLETEYLRINNRNDCIIIQELSNKYEIKSHDFDTNTWNRALLVRYIDNKDGEKIIAHTWNNVVKWGESSNKQPFSHLAVIDIPDLNEIFVNLNQLSSSHYTLPLTARRLDTIDTDNDGDKEIVYLSNREDGRNRNSSWKDVNYIFDLNDSSLSKFGSSHFSHDLMYIDFNDDGFFEVIDYFYDPGGQIEVCDLKENKCTKAKNSTQFIEIGFNHIFPSKDGAIMFGGCPNSGDTTFCWVKVDYKNNKLNFKKLDSYELKPQPKDKAKFLIWTGDVNENKGWWVEGSNKKLFKRARKSWMSASIDYDNDGFIDSVGIEKENLCIRNDISKPFKTPSECKEEAFLYVFKNINDEKFEKHQVIPTTINDTFRIEKADINKDGTIDLYGFRQGYYNPWNVCDRQQLKSVYLNKKNKYFERTSNKLIEKNFGLYGCERASNFFEKDGKYYRLFITTPDAEAEVAYIGIENYTGKFLTNETEDLSDEQLSAIGVVSAEEKKDIKTKQLDEKTIINNKKLIPNNVLSVVSILDDVKPLNKTEASSFKPMIEPVYFDTIGINLTGAKLISFEKNYLMYEGLFNYKEIEFSIPLCSQYWDEYKFIGNLVGFNYMNGFGNIEKLKKYGIGWCGDTVGFFGHWDKNEIIRTETELFPFLKELESNWPMIFGNFTILDDSQNKIIDGWK
jgi:hypothetical protein